MFEQFTESARQVVVLAAEEARALNHRSLGTEHVLLGLLRVEDGVAAGVLESLGITEDRARGRLLEIATRGAEHVSSPSIPFTAGLKKVLELALLEAQTLKRDHISTEHILLGLLGETEGLAVSILLGFGASLEKIRKEVLRLSTGPRTLDSEDMTGDSLKLCLKNVGRGPAAHRAGGGRPGQAHRVR